MNILCKQNFSHGLLVFMMGVLVMVLVANLSILSKTAAGFAENVLFILASSHLAVFTNALSTHHIGLKMGSPKKQLQIFEIRCTWQFWQTIKGLRFARRLLAPSSEKVRGLLFSSRHFLQFRYSQ